MGHSVKKFRRKGLTRPFATEVEEKGRELEPQPMGRRNRAIHRLPGGQFQRSTGEEREPHGN